MAKETKLKYYLSVRWYKGGVKALCRLMQLDGPAESCLLHSELPAESAKSLVTKMKSLGLEITEEQSPFDPPVREQPRTKPKKGFGL